METALEQARIILASASLRRRELLAYFGIPFCIIPSTVPENAQGSGVVQVQELARMKGMDVFSHHPLYPVLSADTLVCLDDLVLGKPATHKEAAKMLSALAGRWHQVHTGVCLHIPDGRVLQQVMTTQVLFRKIGMQELEQYAASDEPMDKAGAYAMQGTGSIFIEQINGSPTNVIGLPLTTVAGLLQDAGLYQ